MKKIFITGITGLLGTNLANELLEQDYHIKALTRNPAKYIGKKSSKLELLPIDLWGNYEDHLEEVEIVIHIAAETATNLSDYNSYDKINHQATARLFEIAKQKKVKQFIFISTANTIGYGNIKSPGTENRTMKKPFSQMHYAQSKFKAEKHLLQHKEHQTQVKILNPTFMLGANDTKPSSGKIILMGLNKKIVFYPPGGKNFVHVKDVVSAIINSFQHAKHGEKYIIAGENMRYREFFKKLATTTKQKQILIPVPKQLLLFAGLIGHTLRALKIKTSLNLPNMKALCTDNYYSNQKSVKELNIQYTKLDHALSEAVEYFQQKNKKTTS